MEDKAIWVQNLGHRYHRTSALQGISFSVDQGEIFGFLGPNGAGKTTTIKILSGQLRPSSGEARVMGFDVVKERDALKPNIGVVFEYQNLYTGLTIRENLNFTASLYGVSRTRVDDMLDLIHLKTRANDNVRVLSNGLKQRLLIARALLHQPRILFLDEPTRGLDANLAREIRALIATLPQLGVTVFLTTHYMEEADLLCQRVAILDQGQIVALDSPEHLKAQSESPGTTLEDVFVELTGRSLSQDIHRGQV
jgi:ABC-2 type transport system ATP-binding protein